jgi:hypothetical protein
MDFSCCPSCKRILDSKDFMNPALLGALDSILPTFQCKTCSYSGLPISMSAKDYEKWASETTK